MKRSIRGPGLAKVERVRLVKCQARELVAVHATTAAYLLATADVVSEGAVSGVGSGARYFGCSSLRLAIESPQRGLPMAGALIADPHLRARILRVARREALARSNQPLGTLYADVNWRMIPEGIEMNVDVEAELLRHAGGDAEAAGGA